MPADTPPSPNHHPNKRPRQSSPERDSPASVPSGEAPSPANELLLDGSGAAHGGQGGGSTGGKAGQSSSFRNVSACNRCRLRKNRCDQKLPSCASCEKANVACVGYDPITKREIPRRSDPPRPAEPNHQGSRHNPSSPTPRFLPVNSKSADAVLSQLHLLPRETSRAFGASAQGQQHHFPAGRKFGVLFQEGR